MNNRSEGPPRRPFSFAEEAAPPGPLATLLFCLVCALLISLAVWMGGTRGWFGDRLLQSGAALLLGVLALYVGTSRSRPQFTAQIWLLVGTLVAVPLLAWIGLSSPAAGDAAGAVELRADLVLAGISQTGFSIKAEQALWSTFPALFILLAASLVGSRARLWLLGLCVLLAIGEGALAITQLSTRGFGWVRFYWPGDIGVYLGTFANRNHLAILLVSLLPLCIAQAAVVAQDASPSKDVLRRVFWGIGAAFLLTGIVGSQSRTGLALGLLAIVATLVAVLRGRALVNAALVGAGALVLWTVAGGHRLLEPMIARLLDPAGKVDRLTYLSNSFDLFSRFGIGGIGLGNFQRLYTTHLGDEGLAPLSVNHVHNDWAELVLETGWIGMVALVLLSVMFSKAGSALWRAWRSSGRSTVSVIPFAAWLGAAAVALHSTVDFPLRTTAVSCVFALLLATALGGLSAAGHRDAKLPRRSERTPQTLETA